MSADSLSVMALRRVDDACARFEAAWRNGHHPRLEEFLTGAAGAERRELLRELLRLELHYRRQAGPPFGADEYARRFPADAALVGAVFAEAKTAAAQTTDDSNRTGPERPTPAAEPQTPRFPTVAGYEILGELGRGAMGVVYRARQTALNRLVALKMIRAGDFAGASELARFRTEAEAIARLRHPNIVQIYDVGEAKGCPYISLEFVEGGSLDRHIAGTPQPARLAADLVAILARAMHAAHQAGVVHRDLKPANILLASATPQAALVPKIGDFGLAKRLDKEGDPTLSGVILGTPSYMAPEQAEGRVKEVGPAADVYALSAILYEMLTGRPPFKGATFRDTIEQVCTREPVPPTQLQPKVPRDLETICLKGLRKEVPQRYASAHDLADDLQRWLDGQPILARPVPAWERAVKWARRRPALAGLVAAVVVAVLGLGAAGLLYGISKSQQYAHGREIDRFFILGQQAEADGRLDEAKEQYDKALATLAADPGAAGDEMRGLLEDRIEYVGRRLKEQAGRQGQLAERQQFAGMRAGFERHRDQVLFRAITYREQDAAADAAAVRQEAALALAEFGVDAENSQALAAGLDRFRAHIEASDLARVAEDCVEVLLTWARIEATAPNADPKTALLLRAGADALRQAHGVAPTTALDFCEAAMEAYRAEHWEAAATACEEALVRRPDHFWPQYVKALCNLRAQRWGEAKVGLDVCLGKHPEQPWLLSLRGIAHVGLKEYDAAEKDFTGALKASDDPAFQAATLTNRSTLRIQQGRGEDAEKDLREAIHRQPNGYQGYIALAHSLEKRGDRAGAIELLDQALKLRPENSALYMRGARLHADAGDRKKARDDFEQVIAREPADGKSDRAVAARVALVHLRLQDAKLMAPEQADAEHAAALADCNAILKVKSDYADVYRQRAEVLLVLNRNAEAAADLDRYLKMPNVKPTSEVWQARGILYTQQKEHAKAVDSYTRALLLKEDADVRSDRGWSYLMQEAAPAALDDFDTALKLKPTHPDALLGRGTALVMRGRPEDVVKATTLADRSLAAGPRTVHRLMACAKVYSRAASVLIADPRRPVDDPEAARYQLLALALLEEALAKVKPKERPAVWNRVVTDRWLLPLQRHPGMVPLARAYGR